MRVYYAFNRLIEFYHAHYVGKFKEPISSAAIDLTVFNVCGTCVLIAINYRLQPRTYGRQRRPFVRLQAFYRIKQVLNIKSGGVNFNRLK